MSERAKVTGIGGIFFRARDPVALADWYREHLGVALDPGSTHAVFTANGDGTDGSGAQLVTVWSTFQLDTTYFGPGGRQWMVNYRVADLDAMRRQLIEAGADVDEKVESYDYGRFGWATDPEGNRFELWEPPRGTPPT
jgi:predicted enzyme related to lactoylglutathione lyase